MKNWLIKQLTEPTAWLCALIIVSVLFTPDWFVVLLCVVGIAMDETAMKNWCAKVAPGLAKKINEWSV